MPVEVRPFGVGCNIRCHYCYQNPQRDAGGKNGKYDLLAIKDAIELEGTSFSLFGGEPLLLPECDLEHLWSWGLRRFGRNGVQTNGVLINDNHIRMFKDYRVKVGISIDGSRELNDVRWAGSLEATRKATEKTEENILRLCGEGIFPNLIITLHRQNAVNGALIKLTEWIEYLDSIEIRSVRLHILEVDNPLVRAKYALSDQENIHAFIHFANLERNLKNIRFDVFSDIRRLLLGRDKDTTCVWNACDPYTTAAVRGVEGNGQRSNCGRTNKDGIDFSKADAPGFERYLALYHTPQEHGGCAGCRFFLICKGQCPGTAIDGDWRNRTEHCAVWIALFEHVEKDIHAEGAQTTSSLAMRELLEPRFIQLWSSGKNGSMQEILRKDRKIADMVRNEVFA